MDANVFYEQWNNSIQSSNTEMKELDLFDDLDLLLDDEEMETSILDKPMTSNSSIKSFQFPVYEINTEQVYNNMAPLQASVLKFCQHYDYTNLSELFGTESSESTLILQWLNTRFGICIDSDYDDSLQNYSTELLNAICPKYRNINLSELYLIVPHISKDYFDASVIKYYALESRDTGLLLELLATNQFNRDEALLYANNVDKFNSYLILKASGKYDAESFNEISKHTDNLNIYTQTVVADHPFAFLGSHPCFNKILKYVQNNDVPVELAKMYSTNPFLYEIIVANSNGLYNANLINNFLCKDNMFAKFMADDYANGKLNSDVLNVYGDYYLAKLVYDVRLFDCDSETFLTELAQEELAVLVHKFSKKLLDKMFSGEIEQDEWLKYIYYLATQRDYDLCDYICNHDYITFNKYCMNKLLKDLGLNASLPDNIGEIILYQNGDKLSYLSIQMYWEAGSTFVKVLKNKLSNCCIKLLPEGYGIIICDKTYSGFSNELAKFNWLKSSKSSLSYGVHCNKFNGTNRYNLVKILEIAQTNNYHIADSFRMLGEIVPEKYLMYDNLLNLICTNYSEFAGLCTCSESLQCLKLFMNKLNNSSHGAVQIEFLKAYLGFKFNKRINFEPYDPQLIQEIRYVEVKDSYNYEQSNISKILSTLDNFVLELNKKHNIVCHFVGTNKIVFEGV